MVISQADWDAMVEHAKEESPNECCGILKLRDGRVEEIVRAHNERQSPYGFQIDSQSMYRAFLFEEDGFGVAGYHSHPRSHAKPSETDINLIEYEDRLNVIISLENAPDIRAWWIRDGRVEEEDIVVE
jgi:proteasome lid subunit RPN8/RPN11